MDSRGGAREVDGAASRRVGAARRQRAGIGRQGRVAVLVLVGLLSSMAPTAAVALPGRTVLRMPELSAMTAVGTRVVMAGALRVDAADLRTRQRCTLTRPGGPTAFYAQFNSAIGEPSIGRSDAAWNVRVATASSLGGAYIAAPLNGGRERTVHRYNGPANPDPDAIRPTGLRGDGTSIYWATWQGIRRLHDGRQTRLSPVVARLYAADAGRVLIRDAGGLAIVGARGVRTALPDVPAHQTGSGVRGEPIFALDANRIAAILDDQRLYTLDTTTGRPVKAFRLRANMPRSLAYGQGLIAWVDGFTGEGVLHVVNPVSGRSAIIARGLFDHGLALTPAGLLFTHRNAVRLLTLPQTRALVAAGQPLPRVPTT